MLMQLFLQNFVIADILEVVFRCTHTWISYSCFVQITNYYAISIKSKHVEVFDLSLYQKTLYLHDFQMSHSSQMIQLSHALILIPI